MSTQGRRRGRTLGSAAAAVLAAVMILTTAAPAGALPPEPVNPSDSEIDNARSEATESAAEVGRLAAQMTMTEGEIDRIRGELQLKQELAKKAVLDVDVASADAAQAQADADEAAAAVDTAAVEVSAAEDAAAEFAAASYRQGSMLGGLPAYLDAGSLNALLDRQQMILNVSANQASVLEQLRTARIAKANAESDAKSELDQAHAAAERAEQAKVDADRAVQETGNALAEGQRQIETLQISLDQQQQAYGAALNQVDALQSQRAVWEQWQLDKAEEEARLRAEAEAAEKARQKAAEEKAAAEAERVRAEEEAAIKAAELKAAAEEAEKKAALEKAAAEKAAADKAAQEKAAKAEAEAKKAAEEAAKAEAAEKAAAEAKAAKAKADAEQAAKEKAEAAASAKAAQEALAQQEAEAKERAKVEGSVYYASCAEVQADGKTTIRRGEPGYRVALDRNANGIACEVLPDSADQWANSGGSTGGGTTTPAPTTPPTEEPKEEPKEETVYYASCAEVQNAGLTTINKGEPGYRKGLDRNGNGVACEILPDSATYHSGGGSSGGGSGSGSGSGSGDGGTITPVTAVDNGRATPRADFAISGSWSAAKGEAAVAAALTQLGVPYSWGGGNYAGPTTGICSGGAAWNDCRIVGFDCSGLTAWAWGKAGIKIPPLTHYQWTKGQRISLSNMLPGDLIFYATNTYDPSSIHHVTMYIGNNQAVEAPYSGSYVKISTVKTSGLIGVIRPGT